MTDVETDVAGYWRAVAALRLAEPALRHGQAAFNALHTVNQPLALRIIGSTLDPYYDDSRLAAFATFVETNWRPT